MAKEFEKGQHLFFIFENGVAKRNSQNRACCFTLKWLNKEALKPCPFCGDEDIREYNEYNHVWLECPECGGRTKMCRTLEEAETLWNRRAGDE